MKVKQDIITQSSKVAIISFVTHSSHLNYGATLHGFAFQQYLKNNGVESVIIDYIPKVLEAENLKYPIFNKKKGQSLIRWALVKLNWFIGFFDNIEKHEKFNNFISNRLNVTPTTYNFDQLQKARTIDDFQFEKFICEADVIWKITTMESIDENFFLNFPASKGKTKIAYAPTISSQKLEGEILSRFIELTKPFSAISTREVKGAEYLQKILKRNITPVLDPTLLLEDVDYNKILIEPKEQKYLLIYNCTVNDIAMVKEAVEYAKKNNLKAIEISNYALNRFIIPHKVRTDVGIEEWLGYFKNASIIFTNSFHGLCFSVLFKKEFFLFQRDNKDYRMQNIVESLGLEERLIAWDTRETPDVTNIIDYEGVYKKLESLRKISHDFIISNIL